jgi:hypothetical protein
MAILKKFFEIKVLFLLSYGELCKAERFLKPSIRKGKAREVFAVSCFSSERCRAEEVRMSWEIPS